MDTKDFMRNISNKSTRMKVSLQKSTIHHDVASANRLILMDVSEIRVFPLLALAMPTKDVVTKMAEGV